MELRLDRQRFPDLPRPVYEVIVEQGDDGARLSVMVGEEQTCRVVEFPLHTRDDFEVRAKEWMLSLEYFDSKNTAWLQAVHLAVARFAAFIFDPPMDDARFAQVLQGAIPIPREVDRFEELLHANADALLVFNLSRVGYTKMHPDFRGVAQRLVFEVKRQQATERGERLKTLAQQLA